MLEFSSVAISTSRAADFVSAHHQPDRSSPPVLRLSRCSNLFSRVGCLREIYGVEEGFARIGAADEFSKPRIVYLQCVTNNRRV